MRNVPSAFYGDPVALERPPELGFHERLVSRIVLRDHVGDAAYAR